MNSQETLTQAWTTERYSAVQIRLMESKRLIDAANALAGGIPGPCLLLRLKQSGAAQLEVISLEDGFVVGRSAECDVSFTEDNDMSGQHFRLIKGDENHWFVLDLDSTNGLWINDTRVSQRRLRHGDKIHAGRQDFVFHDGKKLLGGHV